MANNRRQILISQILMTVRGVTQRMTLGARTVLFDENKVLMLRHTYVPGWQFPGGGVDPGETMEAAARREMFEETGYQLSGEVSLFGIYHNVQATNRDHVALYVAREAANAKPFVANREIAEIGWFDVQALPEEITECTRQRLLEIHGETAQRPNW